jgi:hypothetical protein
VRPENGIPGPTERPEEDPTMERRLTRRQFCKVTTAAAGIGMVPSELAAAADGAPKEVVHDFTVRSVTRRPWPDGVAKKGGTILVNDSLPGPTIRAREGDTIVVRVRNSLPEGTTIIERSRQSTRRPPRHRIRRSSAGEFRGSRARSRRYSRGGAG